MAAAFTLYSELTVDDPRARWDRLEQLVADREEESTVLDFKEVSPKSVASDPYVREKFARGVSAFANTEGGVLVYGVKTNGAPKGTPDAAQSIVEIENPGALRVGLEKLASTCIMPSIPAVRVHHLENPKRQGLGAVVVYVPQSDAPPHRVIGTKTASDDHYFMRTTTECVSAPHAFLELMFGRRPPPRLVLEVRFHETDPVRLDLRLVNRGPGTAQRPALVFEDPPFAFDFHPNSRLTTGFGVRAVERLGITDRLLIEPDVDVTIYPGMSRALMSVSDKSSRPLAIFRDPIYLRGTIYALGMQPQHFEGELPTSTLMPPAIMRNRVFSFPVAAGEDAGAP